MPVATFLMAITMRTDKPRCDIFWNMILVSAGVVIASVGEIHFNIVGTLFQVTGIAAEALRLVLTQVLLQKKGLTLNPITSLYYIAPCRCTALNKHSCSENFYIGEIRTFFLLGHIIPYGFYIQERSFMSKKSYTESSHGAFHRELGPFDFPLICAYNINSSSHFVVYAQR